MSNNIIAITIGDIKGIGIEILIKFWKKNKRKNLILFSNSKILKKYFIKNSIKINLNLININENKIYLKRNKLNIFSYECNSNEENTYKSLKYAYKFCNLKLCIGIINLPLRKDLIKEHLNKKFIGQTEYYQKIDKKKYSNMILFHKKIIISPLTTHIQVKSISTKLKDKKFIKNQIINLHKALAIDFKITNPKLIISGFNPHAGENGKIGNEEKKTIIPVIKNLSKLGINIVGPFSADSMLIKKNFKKYDCFVFIYHDQALIPFKFISQFSGVNYTGNLSIIRTSPDHGTAYDLLGKKNISIKSFVNCFRLISRIYKNRIKNAAG